MLQKQAYYIYGNVHDTAKLHSGKMNCTSAYDHPSVIDKLLKKEVEILQVFGATDAPQVSDVQGSRTE